MICHVYNTLAILGITAWSWVNSSLKQIQSRTFFLISQVNVRPPSNNGECLQVNTFRVVCVCVCMCVCVCVCVCAPIINSENSLVLVHFEEKCWDSLTRILLPW